MAHRGRPITAATVGAALHTLTSEERPAWISRETWRALAAARDGLRADALAAVDGVAWRGRATILDAALSAVQRWMAPGGWIGPDTP